MFSKLKRRKKEIEQHNDELMEKILRVEAALTDTEFAADEAVADDIELSSSEQPYHDTANYSMIYPDMGEQAVSTSNS